MISNSYGGRESGFTQAEAGAYRHPGHVIVASSGDVGFTAANFPANLADVTAVGGTQLARASNARGWTETVYNGNGASGSGCSAYVAKPPWQHDPHCPGRTIADVAALASHVAVYDSSITRRLGGPWLTVYGTSAAAPIVAAVYALAGNAATISPGYEYAHAAALFDVTKGTTTGSRAQAAPSAATTTCAWPRRATTGRPAWARRTAPAPSDPGGRAPAARGAAAGAGSGSPPAGRSGTCAGPARSAGRS